MKAVINLLLITLLTGCHTIYLWDRKGPKAASELHTDQEKKSEYDTFAIAQITPNTWDNGGDVAITSHSDKGKKTSYYELHSFSPVIEKVSPTASKTLEDLHSSYKYYWISFAAAFAGISLKTSENRGINALGDIFYWGGFAGLIATPWWHLDLCADARSEYNKDLHHYIYGDQKSESSSQGGPSVGLKFALDL